MLNTLQQRMSADDFAEFIKDYDTLYQLRENKALWSVAMSWIFEEVFTKQYFDKLENPYEYRFYKYDIQQIVKIKNMLTTLDIQKIEDRDRLKLCISLFYTTLTYIGFIVENALYEEFKHHTKHIIRNNTLDIVKKTDLLLNGHHLQIKNYSFLTSTDYPNKINEYEKANKELFFVFYTIEKDNIYFVEICGNPCTHISLMDGFTFTKPIRTIPLSECVNALLSI